MKRKTKITAVLLLLSGLIIHIAGAQDAGENIFARNLIRALERYDWEISVVGELERNLYAYEWKNLQGVDPVTVAQALSYGNENGSFTAGDLAEMAFQLAKNAGELIRLGFQPREVMLAATNAVRTMTANRVTSRTGEQTPDLAQTFREQLRRQINGTQGSSMQRKAQRQVSRPERSDTWTPPAPEERAGGGRSNIPGGPGDSSGSVTDPPRGSGGR